MWRNSKCKVKFYGKLFSEAILNKTLATETTTPGTTALSSTTVFALATAQGRAGVGVIRVSGPQTVEVLRAILPTYKFSQVVNDPRRLVKTEILDNAKLLDDGMAVFFKGARIIIAHFRPSQLYW
jgi:hypothetical protein